MTLLKYLHAASHTVGLAISNKKNYSAEDGIDGTIGLFRRNSGCFAEQKTLGITFRIIPQRRKRLGILYHGPRIEANSRNSVPNHSAEEKSTRNSVPWNKKRSKLSESGSEACLGQKHAANSVCWSRIFCQTNFFSCNSVLFRASKVILP